MNIQQIKEAIAEQLYSGLCDELWYSVFDNASPGHYGIHDLEVDISEDDLEINPSTQSFTFSNTLISVTARMGSSNDSDGFDIPANFKVTGSGEYEILDDGVRINDLGVNEHLDFYDRPTPEKTNKPGAIIGGAILGASLGAIPGAVIGGFIGGLLGVILDDSSEEESKSEND